MDRLHMPPGRERCAKVQPNCICIKCKKCELKLFGIRCCMNAAEGRGYSVRECGVTACRQFELVDSEEEGNNDH